MKEQFCTYEISLKLKELGFDTDVLAYYTSEKKLKYTDSHLSIRVGQWLLKAPLWQQAQDFFREKYNLHIEFYYLSLSEKWSAEIYRLDEDIWGESVDLVLTYTQVREKAILKAIELCLKKQ